MILDLDIGNTFVKWRCGDRRGQWLTSELNSEASDNNWLPLAPLRIRIASVVDSQLLESLCRRLRLRWGVEPEVAQTSAQAAGVRNSYQDPARMGVDRWLAMIAAFNQQQRSCCVVDCGSAITIDFVDAQGGHSGGYIIPGLRLMRQGLLKNTSRVLVEDEVGDWQNSAPGRSTEEAVGHGLCLVLDSLAARVVDDCRRRPGGDIALVVTGGDGPSFLRSAGTGQLYPELVLDGLAYVLP